MFDINQYFQSYLQSDQIFDNHEVLRPEFIPLSLPHRDLQIRRIAEITACALRNATPSNIFVYGKTGTGKTSVIRYVNQKLNEQCKNSHIPSPFWIYLNCQQVNTGYRVLAKMSEILDPEDPVPISGWPMDVIFEKVLEKLDEKVNRICFLILDEIDVLIKNTARNQDGIIYNLIRINERLKKARVSVIGISNVLNFKNMLDSRVLSSLSQEEIVFPAYDANELSQILSNRAQLAFHEGSVEDDVIPLCAALAAKEHGDARKALDLLRRAGEIAERRNAPKVISEFVYMAQEDLESDKVHEFIENLPPQLKTILLSIYLIQKHQNLKEIITGDVYNCYLEIYPLISGLNKLTQRRVSELVRELDLAGIINARVVSKGRYGRSKMIQLNITTEEARKCLETDKRLCDFLDYHPICLKETGVARFSNHTFQKLV